MKKPCYLDVQSMENGKVKECKPRSCLCISRGLSWKHCPLGKLYGKKTKHIDQADQALTVKAREIREELTPWFSAKLSHDEKIHITKTIKRILQRQEG
jgi:hypothetical protein